MKTYVMTTGGLFGLLVVVHIWRAVVEGPGIAKNPFYILITLAAAGMSLWAWRLVRRSARP